MKNILIPTDFSENAHSAMRYALDYFATVPANFFILHVSHNSQLFEAGMSNSYIGSSGDDKRSVRSFSFLEKEVGYCRTRTENPNHNFYKLYEEMFLVEAIRKQITEYGIDIIVMGTKGDSESNLDEMGSCTYEVITKVKCPIMVIPENAKFNGIKNMAFVTDYNSIYRHRVIDTLSCLLMMHNSPLRVLHIRSKNSKLTPSQIDNKGYLHYSFREMKHSFHFMENVNLEPGIQDFVDTWDISLVAIAAKNLNFIQRLMLRPNFETITYHTNIPFLVIHE